MAIRDTIQIGDPRLKAPNKTIERFDDPIVGQVVQDMIDTMRTNELIGIAAPQIGENYCVFVTEPRETKFRTADQIDELRVYLNPKIVEVSSEETIGFEGCGSLLNGQLFGPVKRPKIITIEAFDQNNKKFRLKCDGVLARVIQHEYDHLCGVEFIEKIFDYRKLMTVDFYIKDIKSSPEQIQASLIKLKEFSFV